MTSSEKRKAYRATPEYREKARLYARKYRQVHPDAKERDRENMRLWRIRHPEHRVRHAELRRHHMYDGLGGKVYFIQVASGPIKIGFTTKRAVGRLEELQIGNHEMLVLRGYFMGTKRDERKLLIEFEKIKLRGEWFKPTEELLALIQSLCITT